MDRFWVTPLEGGKIYEVEIPGSIFFPRKQLVRALLKIQAEGKTILSVRRSPGWWNSYFLVFTQ